MNAVIKGAGGTPNAHEGFLDGGIAEIAENFALIFSYAVFVVFCQLHETIKAAIAA